MSFFANKKKRRIFVWVTSIVAVIAVIVIACAIYLLDYYPADIRAIGAFAAGKSIKVQTLGDDTIVYSPENAESALIFYPGGKVEYTAYEPLMRACADEGIMCVLIEMPFNLAVFDINAADGIREQFPEIENWYIGGHSLGGSMAASYLADNSEDYNGLILLAAYSTEDLSGTDLDVLSVYGSEDFVLNLSKYNKNRSNLPSDFTELIIDGGCHAYFGMYGAQDGDGIPTVSNEEQIYITADAISELINNK